MVKIFRKVDDDMYLYGLTLRILTRLGTMVMMILVISTERNEKSEAFPSDEAPEDEEFK